MDVIPANILKGTSDILKSPLTKLYKISVGNRQFPHHLEFANVTPLFKNDDSTDKANYRPVSVLPSTSKLFERLMFKQITNCRKHHFTISSQHVLLRLLDKLNKSVDKAKKVGVFMMDLSKAFDCISHDLLIAKLHAYGFEKPNI